MKFSTPAKINLTLDIVGKRDNGYHDVYMLMQTISIYDEIEINKAEKISVTCNLPYIPTDKRNIVYRAAQSFYNTTGIDGGVNIRLNKKIPVGAGLGGGSSNAAGVLMAMNEIYNTHLSNESLKELALVLGSDVPFFIEGGTCIAEGLGEKLTPLENNIDCYYVVIKPSFSVSTKWVYENLKWEEIDVHPDTELVINALKNGDIKTFSKNMVNVLETVTCSYYKDISKLKDELIHLGASGSLMSGSGSAVFGVFEDESAAYDCANYMKRYTKDIFVVKNIDKMEVI